MTRVACSSRGFAPSALLCGELRLPGSRFLLFADQPALRLCLLPLLLGLGGESSLRLQVTVHVTA